MARKQEEIVRMGADNADARWLPLDRAELSSLDWTIVSELQRDGRVPFSALATRLGVSEGTIQRRTQQMIGEGYFKIVGVVDAIREGAGYVVLSGLTCDPSAIRRVSAEVAEIPEMRFVSMVAGTHDVVCELMVRDREAMTSVLT